MIEVFERHRSALLRLAYQFLGSVALAEEVVQDTYLKWSQADIATIHNPEAYLRRILARLCMDYLKSAQARREVYVGPWLPEPLVYDEPVVTGDVSVALLLALERLSPPERAAFLLHDILEMEFEEVGRVLNRSTVAVRKLASRARVHVRTTRTRCLLTTSQVSALTEAFLIAARAGDHEQLLTLLARDAQLHSDGGGKRLAALRIIHGAQRIARFFAGISPRGVGPGVAQIKRVTINDLPGFILTDPEGRVETYAFAFSDDQISDIYIVRNPDKLQHLHPT